MNQSAGGLEQPDKSVEVLEKWALETAALLAPSLQGFDLKRVAIGLIQARGEQMQLISGQFAVGEAGMETKAISRRLNIDANGALAIQFADWNAWLQDVATKFAERILKETEIVVIQ